MLEYIKGDIFTSPAQVIVNTVNTVGVMGKGIALEYKQRYPDMFEHYKTQCEKKKFRMGDLMLWYAPDHWILLFPTKENWRNPSRLDYIEIGLKKFIKTYTEKNISSIAFPKLGCGNGELDWNAVQPLMEQYLKKLPIDVYIYLGNEETIVPEHKNQKETIDWMKKMAKDMSFNSVKEDIQYNSSIIPITFPFESSDMKAKWESVLLFYSDQGTLVDSIDEDTLFNIWDNIRSCSIFPIEQSEKRRARVCALLGFLGYLTNIKIQDSKTKLFLPGYQVNEGSGRIFSLKG